MITITEARHTQRRSGRKFDLVLCEKDLAFSSDYSKTPERPTRKHASSVSKILYSQGTVEFSDILCTITEHLHLSRCVKVCFTGAEEDTAEQHGLRTIDEASGDADVKQGEDTAEEAGQEADSSEQISPSGLSQFLHYTSDHETEVDMLEVIDPDSTRSSILEVTRTFTIYDQLCTDREFNCCSPSIHTRLQVFTYDWSRQTDWPGLVRYCQGRHDRCIFSSTNINSDMATRPVKSERRNSSMQLNDEATR